MNLEDGMKMLSGIGVVLLVLGIASFFIPLPQKEDHSVKVGDARIGVQTQHNERVPPVVSAALLLGGAVMMVAGRGRS